jgi:hypothetical protein
MMSILIRRLTPFSILDYTSRMMLNVQQRLKQDLVKDSVRANVGKDRGKPPCIAIEKIP